MLYNKFECTDTVQASEAAITLCQTYLGPQPEKRQDELAAKDKRSSNMDDYKSQQPPQETSHSLRFAALIRVSTEAQKKRGESLAVQRDQILDAVSRLDGAVENWYGGQEHATAGWERTQVDKMLSDAQAGKFDAVMVADLSRWSRDNMRAKQDQAVLRKLGIRFFVLGNELDLNKSEHRLIAGLTTEMNEFFAGVQAEKSISARIRVARRGQPTCGKLPWGRSWSLAAGWAVKEADQKRLQAIAKEYLQGKVGFQELADNWNINVQVLHKLLVGQRPKGTDEPDPPVAGSVWMQRFRLKSAKIAAVIPTPVPPLLDEATLKAIKAKAEARRTWSRGQQKNTYLFSRKIFDATTGYALTGVTNARGRRYYRPFKDRKGHYWSVRADHLEYNVLSELGRVLSSDTAFTKAVFEGHDTSEQLEADLLKQRAVHQHEVDKARQSLDRVVKAYLDGFTKEQVAPHRDAAQARLDKHQAAIDAIHERIETLPKVAELETERLTLRDRLKAGLRTSMAHHAICSMVPLDQETINAIFGGKDPEDRRYGIYITPRLDGDRRSYTFEAYGKLGTVTGHLRPRDIEPYGGDYSPPDGHASSRQAETLGLVAKLVAKDLGIKGKTTFVER